MTTNETNKADFFGTASIYDVCFKLAPPIILAQLIQALYNIVDSYFVGQCSGTALTALAVIYPLQWFILALGLGAGVGVNTMMARRFGEKLKGEANAIGGTGMLLAIISWLCFFLLTLLFLRPYVAFSTTSPEVMEQALSYGYITCFGCLPLMLESVWSKIHQAEGNMTRPMLGQTAGAFINILLDKILIFGYASIPALGVIGAAIATVLGQLAAALTVAPGAIRTLPNKQQLIPLTKLIAQAGFPVFIMNALFTFYISCLNMVLVAFSEAAVTVLGLYYKVQTFFFLPMIALQNCLLPFWSYNYGAKNYGRCREFFNKAILIGSCFMSLAAIAFIFFNQEMLSCFSTSPAVLTIGATAFPIIGYCFIPANCALIISNFLMSVGYGKFTTFLILLRQIVLMVPLAYYLGTFGINYVWYCFPITETIITIIGFSIYRHQYNNIYKQN